MTGGNSQIDFAQEVVDTAAAYATPADLLPLLWVRREERKVEHSSSWQRDDKFGTCHCGMAHTDLAAMCFDESLRDRHTETGSFGLCREEGIEDSLLLLLGESRPAVADADSKRRDCTNSGIGAMNLDAHRIIAGHE